MSKTVTIKLEKEIYQDLQDYVNAEFCHIDSAEELISDLCREFVDDYGGLVKRYRKRYDRGIK